MAGNELFHTLTMKLVKLIKAVEKVYGQNETKLFEILSGCDVSRPLRLRDKEITGYLVRAHKDEETQIAVDAILDFLLPLRDPMRMWGAAGTNKKMPYFWSIATEAVWLKQDKKDQRLKVWLTLRKPSQTPLLDAYQNQWHCPGTIWRPKDDDTISTMCRLSQKEGMRFKVDEYYFVGNYPNYDEERGKILSLVYLVISDVVQAQETDVAKWWDIKDALEDQSVVDHHRDAIIPMACRKYLELRNISPDHFKSVVKDGLGIFAPWRK